LITDNRRLTSRKEENKQAAFKFDYGTNDDPQDPAQGSTEDEEQELLKDILFEILWLLHLLYLRLICP
jgi:hypothetical protein